MIPITRPRVTKRDAAASVLVKKGQMAKNRLTPLLLNLLALGVAVAAVASVYLTLGRGLWFQVAISLLFSLPWGAQFLLLAVAANARRKPPALVSKLTFSAWGAASLPFSCLMAPPGIFPPWFVLASAPLGFFLCYTLISMFLWMVSLLPRWPLPWTKKN